MRYEVLVTLGGRGDFKRLPPLTRVRIRTALLSLERGPRSKAEKLAGRKTWRRRMGDYRIVLRVDDRAREVLVARIKHKRDAYRR